MNQTHLQDLTRMVWASLLRWLLRKDIRHAQNLSVVYVENMEAIHQVLNSVIRQDLTM